MALTGGAALCARLRGALRGREAGGEFLAVLASDLPLAGSRFAIDQAIGGLGSSPSCPVRPSEQDTAHSTQEGAPPSRWSRSPSLIMMLRHVRPEPNPTTGGCPASRAMRGFARLASPSSARRTALGPSGPGAGAGACRTLPRGHATCGAGGRRGARAVRAGAGFRGVPAGRALRAALPGLAAAARASHVLRGETEMKNRIKEEKGSRHSLL